MNSSHQKTIATPAPIVAMAGHQQNGLTNFEDVVIELKRIAPVAKGIWKSQSVYHTCVHIEDVPVSLPLAPGFYQEVCLTDSLEASADLEQERLAMLAALKNIRGRRGKGLENVLSRVQEEKEVRAKKALKMQKGLEESMDEQDLFVKVLGSDISDTKECQNHEELQGMPDSDSCECQSQNDKLVIEDMHESSENQESLKMEVIALIQAKIDRIHFK